MDCIGIGGAGSGTRTGPAGPASPSAPVPLGDDAAGLRAILHALPVGVLVEDESGALLFENAQARTLSGPGQRTVDTAARTVALAAGSLRLSVLHDVTEQRRDHQELFERAYIDELTGLPNRSLLERSAEQLIRDPDVEHFALAFVDIDNFKHINDYYSHATGDALLVKISDRISSLLRETDILARISGDEFVLLLTPLVCLDALEAQVTAFAARLRDPFYIDGHEIFASASIGVSIYPLHGEDCDTLKRNADCAMYRIKGGTKGAVAIYDDAMSHAATARSQQEQRFRLAIRDRRFTCALQPKVDLRSREVHGVEVLLRWLDEGGLIQAPGEFVALAIELGLINDISFLVLEEVVASLDEIDAFFGPDVTVSLNVAARQAVDVAFMTAFCDALAATGVPERFMIEITEEAMLEKDHFQRVVLPKLRAIGTKVSIDDFGVGYSSLAALADVTADEVKIDRSFITDIHRRPRSQSILKAIESLARSLGMAVVAEGVETHEELVWLQAATEIRAAQGFYFSRPIPLAAIVQQAPGSVRAPVAAGRLREPARVAAGR